MTDLLAILTSNAPAWGVTLTLVIAGLIASAVLLYRYIVKLDAEIQKLKAELEAKFWRRNRERYLRRERRERRSA